VKNWWEMTPDEMTPGALLDRATAYQDIFLATSNGRAVLGDIIGIREQERATALANNTGHDASFYLALDTLVSQMFERMGLGLDVPGELQALLPIARTYQPPEPEPKGDLI